MAKVELKVVMLGAEYCGKTSMAQQYLYHRFAGEDKYQNTIGAAFGAREVNLGGKRVIMGLWDTAGSERYEAMSRMYYRGARAAVICYAVNDAESWTRLKFWVNEIKRLEENCRIYVAATKIDLLQGQNKARAVDYPDTTDYVDEIGAQLFETSSKEDTGVSALFQKIAKDYLEDCEAEPAIHPNHTDQLNLNRKSKKKSSCCPRN